MIDDFLGYKYFPKDKDELKKIIGEHYKNHNYNLNDIDVSEITDFSKLFYEDEHITGYKDFDISHWDVSNGVNFSAMFCNCYDFNCDISRLNVSNGQDFNHMFFGCENFNSDLS
ncbi:BspA family leucine-rich repeat surface protein [bacterium]|nr:BspA family leucine-rich repeat surface protein [bacterium]